MSATWEMSGYQAALELRVTCHCCRPQRGARFDTVGVETLPVQLCHVATGARAHVKHICG